MGQRRALRPACAPLQPRTCVCVSVCARARMCEWAESRAAVRMRRAAAARRTSRPGAVGHAVHCVLALAAEPLHSLSIYIYIYIYLSIYIFIYLSIYLYLYLQLPSRCTVSGRADPAGARAQWRHTRSQCAAQAAANKTPKPGPAQWDSSTANGCQRPNAPTPRDGCAAPALTAYSRGTTTNCSRPCLRRCDTTRVAREAPVPTTARANLSRA